MVTEAPSLEVLLLEVNVSPDISKSTPITARLVEAAVDDLFRLIIDEEKSTREPPVCPCPTVPVWELWAKFPKLKTTELVQFAYGTELLYHLFYDFTRNLLIRSQVEEELKVRSFPKFIR
jgi:hypothetical protein